MTGPRRATEVDRGDTSFEIEPASMRTSGKCPCCAKVRRTAWGYVYREGGPYACYFVEWTRGQNDCTSRVDVVIGKWFDGTTDDDRATFSFECSLAGGRPSFAVADADGRPAAEIGRPRRAADVRGTAGELEALAV